MTNKLSNYILSLHGENYGIHVLCAIKNQNDKAAEILHNVKNAVLVGKDRQSDYLSYVTSSELVQKSLSEKKCYILTRSPEPVLNYVDNAKKQMPIKYPVAVLCNTNGDQFILDSGAASIHAFDSCSVEKSYIIGLYNKASHEEHVPGNAKLKGCNLKLSHNLMSMTILQDDLHVSDVGRMELAVLKKCYLAKNIRKSVLYVGKDVVYISVASYNDGIAALKKENNGQEIDIFALDLIQRNIHFLLKGT